MKKKLSVLAAFFSVWLLGSVVWAQQTGVTNPLHDNSIEQYVSDVLQLFVRLAIPVLAFFIVMSGFSFVLARGNPSALAKAKKNFLYVIIGTCLVLGAFTIAAMIRATVSQITG